MGCSASVASRPSDLQASSPTARPSDSSRASQLEGPRPSSQTRLSSGIRPVSAGGKGDPAGSARPRPVLRSLSSDDESDGNEGQAAQANQIGSRTGSSSSSRRQSPLETVGGSSGGVGRKIIDKSAEGLVRKDDHPLAAVCNGITLRGLRKLRQHIRHTFGDGMYKTLSTAEVNTAFVQRVTATWGCRLAELPQFVGSEDLGAAHYFVSHAWKNGFDLLCAGIEAFLQSASETTRVWLDIIAVNQHAGPYQTSDVAAFKDVVQACSGGTLMVMDLTNCNPASRAWCVYEWAATLSYHGPDGLHMWLTNADRAALVSELDIEKAECYNPEDKVAILADVVTGAWLRNRV